jgi:hypothetical protein
VMRIGLPENLERVLASTNLIENLLRGVRSPDRKLGSNTGRTAPCCYV